MRTVVGSMITVVAATSLTLQAGPGTHPEASQPSQTDHCRSYYYNYDQCDHPSGGGWGRQQTDDRDRHDRPHHDG